MKRKDKIEKALEQAEEIEYDEEGRAVIQVGLKSKDDFYNPYGYRSYKMLNSDMLSYIKKSAQKIPSTKKISLNIYTEIPTSNEDKKQMKDTIQRQFAEDTTMLKRTMRKNLLLVTLLMALGIGILAVGFLLESLKVSSIISETIVIIAWVFEWEAAEMFFFNHMEHHRKMRILKHFLNCEISVKEYQ